MHWPTRPVDTLPPDAFVPPFCPWPRCRAHANEFGGRFCFHRHGTYSRDVDQRVVQRFLCRHCKRTFSQQTFSTTYYLKQPQLLVPVAAGLVAGSAHRQIARSLHCSHTTVTRLSARLGRHAILLQSLAIQSLSAVSEPLVHDDFETFAYSQEQPMGIGTTAGSVSWFIYGLQNAPHRRGGRARRGTRRLRAAARHVPVKDLRGAYVRSCRNTLEILVDKVPPGERIVLSTDDHPAYRAAMSGLPERDRFVHRIYPNPKRPYKGAPRSAEARMRDRAMFAVDTLHSFMRHSLSHFGRESLAFGRRHNAVMERSFLFVGWRNFVKGRSERRPDPTTPAMRLGLTDSKWDWDRLLAQRLFPSRIRVPEPWLRIYRRDWITPAVGLNQRHRLAHAY